MKEIEQLISLCGILPGYHDIKGNYHTTPYETKLSILRAMGYDLDPLSVEACIERKKQYPWVQMVEPVHVFSGDESIIIPFYLPADYNEEDRISIRILLKDESGCELETFEFDRPGIIEERFIQNRRYIKIPCRLDVLNPGYYDLDIEIRHPSRRLDDLRKGTRLIMAPSYAYIPAELENKRCWGISLNLYSIRSNKNWGVGDFGDLKRLIEWLRELGADFIGINPIHAISNTVPYGISPYAPLSRLYKNFIYLDLDSLIIPDKEALNFLRQRELIDYEGVASLKLKTIRLYFKDFLNTHYKKGSQLSVEFREYINNEGEDLHYFALFMALSERFNTFDWLRWPLEFQNPRSLSVKEFADEEEEDILFFKYLQWLIDNQHRDIYTSCQKNGLFIGLYHDLAIGAVRESCDVWANRELFCIEMAVGAPPDDFSPDGQNWGFPPLIPDKLRENRYDFFIKILRKNMKYAGAIRIDHAPGLFRQFWIPQGMNPNSGAYVTYPGEELLKIISLESIRNRTIIIAEDLGTVSENVRESLQKYKMLSYKLFYFERRYPEPSFLEPSRYPALSLSAVTTHDLPTLYGFWKAVDIEQRKFLKKYPFESMAETQLEERQRDKVLIIEALKKEGLIHLDREEIIPDEMTEELCLAIYAYLARTPSRLVSVSLDDIIGATNQQNMPGTVDSYPNWRQKTILSLEEIIKDKRFYRLKEIFQTSLPPLGNLPSSG